MIFPMKVVIFIKVRWELNQIQLHFENVLLTSFKKSTYELSNRNNYFYQSKVDYE